MNENNQFVRFLDSSTTEMIKEIKEKAQQSLDESAKLRKTLVEAQQKITEQLKELDELKETWLTISKTI